MDEREFSQLGKLCVEQMFRSEGSVRKPLLMMEREGILLAFTLEFSEEIPIDELHTTLLNTLETEIRKADPPELFVGYEGFMLRDEVAIRVLVGIHYSDAGERFWVAPTHGSGVGDWMEAPDDLPLFGFEGLWNRAKSYLRN